MRLCLLLAFGLLPGCITIRSVLIDGYEVQTSYLGPIPLRQTTQLARPKVEFDEGGKPLGAFTSNGYVALGVEFDFCGRTWIAEEIIVTPENTILPYGNGEELPVDLNGHESVKLIRVAMKAEDGQLREVDYQDFPQEGANGS